MGSRFVVNASKGEFGISYQLRRPVSELITERLPATIELVVISALIALITGTLLGVYTGINRKGFLSDFVLAISLLGVSLPTFVIGILFIYLFAVILGILPSFGRGEVVDLGFWTTGFLTVSGLKAIILPSVTLSLFQMTYIIRLVRAEMMEILQTDYIKFARARGISENSIKYKHALKKWIDTSNNYSRNKYWNFNCIFNYYRNCFSMAWYGLLIYSSSSIRRYTNHVSLFSFYSFCFRNDKFYS